MSVLAGCVSCGVSGKMIVDRQGTTVGVNLKEESSFTSFRLDRFNYSRVSFRDPQEKSSLFYLSISSSGILQNACKINKTEK